ncbi:MAG: hypothetical protein Q9217_006299 [Psora testacea]
MTRFRPCIDLHASQVKQIIGGSLGQQISDLKTNHVSKLPATYFAKLYKDHGLAGAHVIMLGPGNEEAAQVALEVWPGGLQIGGGINNKNAARWIEQGAEKVIVTSYLFEDAKFSMDHLNAVLGALGNDTNKLVIDLSCRRQHDKWIVAMNKWQKLTDVEINEGRLRRIIPNQIDAYIALPESIKMLEPHCSEFLIHAADNEGLQRGIDEELVEKLGCWCSIPVTYAGGGKSIDDLEKVKKLSGGKVDLTIGSALDIFGGQGVKFIDCVEWNRRQKA